MYIIRVSHSISLYVFKRVSTEGVCIFGKHNQGRLFQKSLKTEKHSSIELNHFSSGHETKVVSIKLCGHQTNIRTEPDNLHVFLERHHNKVKFGFFCLQQ